MSNTNTHKYNIEKLKIDFENIIALKQEIAKTKIIVAEILNQLKTVYNDLLKSNSKKIFLFCLDSFYFQYKTFAMEMDNIDKFRSLLNNRMYCDYYKLYNIIVNNVKDNKIDITFDNIELKSYPPYKDLEPFQEYKLDDIRDIHENILQIINELYTQCNKKQSNIDNYNENHRIGFSISNFINTLNYENAILNHQISLYVNYLSFFHISQKKQLNRLFGRITDFCKEVEDNVNINRTFSIDDIENQEKLHRFFSIGDEIDINNILEDSELLIENTEKFIGKIDAVIQNSEIAKVTFTDEPVVIENAVENISIEITDDNEKTDVSTKNNENA
jgi:hypothetical protein